MEQFEEFKRDILKMIQNREEIPEAIIKKVEEIFFRIQNIYEENGCLNPSILEGLESELYVVKRIIKEGEIATDRKDEKFEGVLDITRRMEHFQEEMEEYKSTMPVEELQEQQKRKNNQFREEFSEIGSDNSRTAARILDLVEDALKDINLRQRRILYNRGQLSETKVDEVCEEVLSFLRRLEDSEIEEIIAMLKEDDNTLRTAILSEYDNYIEQTQAIEAQNDAKAFRASLNGGITLEEQAETSRKFMEGSFGQPGNIDKLPDVQLD